MNVALLLAAALLWGGAFPLQAQTTAAAGPLLVDVVLEGQVGVHHDLLRANLRSRSGTALTQQAIDEDIRWLADTHGVLAEAAIEAGPVVRFRLSRIRRYEGLAVEGNVRYDAEELLGVARLSLERDATPDQLAQGRDLVRDHYLRGGFAFCQVDVRTRAEADGRRIAVLRVYEGPQVQTEAVRIEGLTALDPDDALAVMRSPPSWWHVLFGKDFVRSDTDTDVVLLENFVRGEGYLDGRTALGPLTWNEDRTRVGITLVVEQGERYHLRSVAVEGHQALTEAELLAGSVLVPGAPWRRHDVIRTLRAMRDLYGRLGYLDAEIEPVETYDEHEALLDVTWRVREGVRKHVRDVIVRGNSRTRDVVVRRYLTLGPGDVADRSELEWSEDLLVSLDYFTDLAGRPQVRVDAVPAPDPAQVDLVVDVNDEQSGLFNFVVGAGSDSGLFAGVSVDKHNFDITRTPSDWSNLFTEFFGSGDAFHGAGQRLYFEVVPGTQTTNVDVLFRDPWLDPGDTDPWGLTLELYDRRRIFSDYDRDRLGAAVSFDKRLDRHTSVSVGLRLEQTEISDVDPAETPTIAKFEGTTSSRALELALNHRAFDSLVETTRGWAGGVRLESAGNGLGGDTDLVRLQATTEWYIPIREDEDGRVTVLHPRLAIGRVQETGSSDEVPFFENYFVGGATGPFALRGFRYQGVGPQESGNALGGKLAAVASVEALIPLVSNYNPFRDEEESVLKGVFWIDAGSLVPDGSLEDLGSELRWAAGTGLRVRIPALGGITLVVDYALITHDKDDDETRTFSFELSRRF